MGGFIKNNKDDKIWWYIDKEEKSDFAFSFDKKTILYVFRDYEKLTKKQRKIFDEENPYWKEFFAGEDKALPLWRK